MKRSISITLGVPKHGWLPVSFRYADFQLDLHASDVLNDPIDELFLAATRLNDNQRRRVTCWLEPAAYYFDFERKGEDFKLTISETDYMREENADGNTVITISGNERQIIEPLRTALKQFSTFSYAKNDWPYMIDKHQLRTLG